MLLTNRNYVLLLCGFGMGLGLFNAIITVIAQLIAPCGYTSTQAGMLSGIIIGSGLFGAAVAGPVCVHVPLLTCFQHGIHPCW